VILVAGLVVGGLVSLLLLNTVLAQDAYALHSLQKETATLADSEQALVQQVAQDESPAALATRARELGLVPAPNPVFVRGADGTVLGVATPAEAPAAEGEPAR
jgi:cell division protein FtsB